MLPVRAWYYGKQNISFRGMDLPLKGVQGSPEEIMQLKALMARLADGTKRLVQAIFARYRGHVKRSLAAYRTARVEGQVTNWRQHGTRPHVDAFPANPGGGVRLLSVFCNVNPAGLPRV